jgi:hypothetical protein
MVRFAALFGVVVIACGGSGFETGPADLTGISPAIMSAGAVSFTGSDGSGNQVLGWKLQFFSNGSGYDCLSNSADELADLDIYTNHAPSGSMRAMVTVGDTPIVPANPPTATGTGPAAHFAIDGIHQVNGDLTLSDVHINTSSNQIDRFVGMVTAAGTSDAGDTINVAGMFTAPVCE